MSQQYRWKGKLVSEKQYLRRVAQSRVGKSNKKPETCDDAMEPTEPKCILEGRGIIDWQVFSNHMVCTSCKAYLSLKFVRKVHRRGLGWDLHIQCHECLLLNHVPTGNKHRSARSGKRDLFNVNTKAVAGALHSGQGETHLNKQLALLDIPVMSSETFKSYETEVGLAAERVADQSCREAADIERALTLQNIDTIANFLPATMDGSFLLPSRPVPTAASASTSEQHPVTSTPLPAQPGTSRMCPSPSSLSTPRAARRRCFSEGAVQEQDDPDDPGPATDVDAVLPSDPVRIMCSYDMGYSTRGNGRQYDSLNGYAALIGCLSGKVLEYGTRNRKCRLCDRGRKPEDHDCRFNFQGSAKAMEADCAAELCNRSQILSDSNVQVGLFVADDDTSHIAKVRETSSHPVVKLSDRNHITRGVDRILYGLEKTHQEVSREAVHYLHRCFAFAVSQNKGDSVKMAEAVRNIPEHCFNRHDNCGDWCGYVKDRENYDHSTIPGGFQSENLYQALKNLFDKLADNTAKYAHCASSQANESLNNTMASKAPKSRCYSTSASADYRFAFSVASKNLGEEYVGSVIENEQLEKSGLTPVSKRTKKHLQVRQKKAMRRKLVSSSQEGKLNRVRRRKEKTILRKKKERVETGGYETAMGLLTQPAFNFVPIANPQETVIIFYDIETSSLARDCDILQLAARCGNATFDRYINPVKKISAAASNINQLTNVAGELHYRGVRVSSVPLRVALQDFYSFLAAFHGSSLLVAHNGHVFDSVRVVNAIKGCNLVKEFKQVIRGFADTLHILKKKLGRNNRCSQSTLAQEFLQISDREAHNATVDVEILQKLAIHFQLGESDYVSNLRSMEMILDSNQRSNEIAAVAETLKPLKNVLSSGMISKIATAGLTFDDLFRAYTDDQEEGIYKLFTEGENGSARITNSSKIINDVNVYFEILSAFDIV